MPNTDRTTSANGHSARDPQKLSKSSAKNPTCQAGAAIRDFPPENFAPISVRPDGRETFFPPLDPTRMYQVTVRGTCAYWEWGFIFDGPKAYVDALYEADDLGNFVKKHDCLELDGKSLRYYLMLWREDRAAHEYTFRIPGTVGRISAKLSLPWNTQAVFRAEGALTIFVEPLPEGTPSPVYNIAREEKLFKEMRAAKEKANRDKKAAEERAAVENKLAALRCRAHRENYFLNPDFQLKYARHHLHEISSKLKAEWASEYDALMQLPQFKQLAAKEAPEVLQWLESRVNIVRLAEQMIASPPALQSQNKPKLTAEQVRALKVRRDGIQAEDRIARKKLKAEKLVKARAELESIPLDPDEKESLGTELAQEIRDIGEEEINNVKRGTTL
jgi:hypothetical protein